MKSERTRGGAVVGTRRASRRARFLALAARFWARVRAIWVQGSASEDEGAGWCPLLVERRGWKAIAEAEALRAPVRVYELELG